MGTPGLALGCDFDCCVLQNTATFIQNQTLLGKKESKRGRERESMKSPPHTITAEEKGDGENDEEKENRATA